MLHQSEFQLQDTVNMTLRPSKDTVMQLRVCQSISQHSRQFSYVSWPFEISGLVQCLTAIINHRLHCAGTVLNCIVEEADRANTTDTAYYGLVKSPFILC